MYFRIYSFSFGHGFNRGQILSKLCRILWISGLFSRFNDIWSMYFFEWFAWFIPFLLLLLRSCPFCCAFCMRCFFCYLWHREDTGLISYLRYDICSEPLLMLLEILFSCNCGNPANVIVQDWILCQKLEIDAELLVCKFNLLFIFFIWFQYIWILQKWWCWSRIGVSPNFLVNWWIGWCMNIKKP